MVLCTARKYVYAVKNGLKYDVQLITILYMHIILDIDISSFISAEKLVYKQIWNIFFYVKVMTLNISIISNSQIISKFSITFQINIIVLKIYSY